MFDLLCLDSEPTLFGFLDPSIAPTLLYYAYIPTALISLILGLTVLRNKANFHLPNKLFFILTILFALYISDEILLWIMTPSAFVHFGWILIALFFSTLTVTLVYFFYTFTNKCDVSFKIKFLSGILLLPIFILLPTTLNMSAFDLVKCESSTGALFAYIYTLMSVAALVTLIHGFLLYIKTRRSEIIFISLGTASMIVILLFSDVLAELTRIFEINLIGPFGMLIFLIVLSFLIVKYKAFNIKLIGAQALVISLWFLVGSLLFVAKSDTTRIIAGITLLITTIAGYYLVKSVKKGVALREQIEELAGDLAKANVRLKELDKMKSEFVSIASHQLRSPLTSIRGYASMLVEGTYGKLPEKAVDVLKNISDSARFMAQSVEDYLNVSRIEAGNMKYELSDFNLKEQAEKIVDEMRQVVMKAGLVLLFRSENTGNMIVHADIGKTRQIINNIIDNAMKYTPHGTITVIAHDDIKQKKAIITIHDTGIGMDEDTRNGVFNKFVRAKNANSVNTSGTGLGLYVAKIMVEKMGGTVWAESEGQGKGSVFHIEFPLV